MSEAVKIKATVMWADLVKVNEMSEKYQVNLCNLSPKAVAALEEMGLSLLNKDGQGDYITVKSSRPMKAFDTDGVEIDGSIVGNGSTAVAVLGYYDWRYKSKEGRSPSMKRLVIDNLVEYGDGEDVVGFDDAEEAL
jgi:hypothetical protein